MRGTEAVTTSETSNESNGTVASRVGPLGGKVGDVTVPTDLRKLPPLPMWASVTQILSNMAVSVAALKTIKAL